MTVHTVQGGEREMVDDCRSLARFALPEGDIPPAAAAQRIARVTLPSGAMARCLWAAMEKSTGVQAEIQVKPSRPERWWSC